LRPLAAEKEEDDCLLLLKLVDYEDDTLDEEVWACEFPHQLAVEVLNGNEFMDISGISKDVIDAFHPISGASILNTRDVFVEQALDTKVMTLMIPEDAQVDINVIEETHPRHHKQRRNRNRNLQGDPNNRALGEMSVLVVKVVDTNGVVNPLEDTMSTDWFGTSTLTFKSGFEQCSHNQLIMKPAVNIQVPYQAENQIENGVLTVTLDIAVTGEDLQNKAYAAAQAAVGPLYDQFDLVAFCQPPNGGWVAYAYVNSWASFFNGRWCNRPSAQLHEIGHNLNMGHSNEPNRAGSQNNIVEGSRQDAFVGGAYGDQSALMAYSYDVSDGPKMCFNAPKNFQFGWYVNQQLSYDPLLPSNIDTPKQLTLNGVNEYKTNGEATNGKLINVRLVQDGDTYGRDYYIGFNDKYGINSGTIEEKNQVLLFVKDTGGPNNYGESSRLAGLGVGQSVTIKDYGSTNTTLADVTIFFESLTNRGRDANIIITTLQPQSQLTPGPINPPTSDSPSASPSSKPSTSPTDAPPPPTKAPTDSTSPPTKAPTTKPTDPPTSLPGTASPTNASTTKPPTKSPTTSPTNAPTTKPVSQPPSASPSSKPSASPTDAPPPPSSKPSASPTDSTPPPTKAPTTKPTDPPTSLPVQSPTPAPVSQPTPSPINPPVCPKNSKKVVYVNKKGKKKKCSWVKTGKTLKIRTKRCNSKKYSYLGKRIKENCPSTCGKYAGKGICKNLFLKNCTGKTKHCI
jgi:hypothetical protein